MVPYKLDRVRVMSIEPACPCAGGHTATGVISYVIIRLSRHRQTGVYALAGVPFYADGKPGPAIELRDLFAQFLNEVGQSAQ